MTQQALAAALGTTVALCLVMILLVALIKAGRGLSARRRATLLAPYRQDLLVVGAGEDHDGAGARRLASAAGSSAGAVTDAVVALLGKIRGEELVHLLTSRGKVAQAVVELSSSSRVKRAQAAHLLGLCRVTLAVPHLIEALGDSAVEARARAAQALGMIGDAVAAPPLLRAVGATDAGVPAGVAVEALLAMGMGIADALRDGLSDSHPRTRTVAAYVSGAGSFTRSRPQLRSLLSDDPDLTVRETCAAALGVIGGAADVVVLAQHTHDDVPLRLRRVCATALGDLGDPAALPALGALLDDPDPRLAELAAAAILRLGPGPASTLSGVAGAEGPDPRRGRPVESALLVARLQGLVR